MKMKLFRNQDKSIKSIEEIYQEVPENILFLLSRYKFAAKLLESNDVVFDAGCGLGFGSVMLSRFTKSVTGGDVDYELIKYCCNEYKINNLDFKIIDITNNINNKFDGIVCMDVIKHFDVITGKKVINNLYNALNDGGILIVGTPNMLSQKYASENRKSSHIYEYDYKHIKKLLSYNFKRNIIFSMTDEIVNTGFSELAWYFIGVAIK